MRHVGKAIKMQVKTLPVVLQLPTENTYAVDGATCKFSEDVITIGKWDDCSFLAFSVSVDGLNYRNMMPLHSISIIFAVKNGKCDIFVCRSVVKCTQFWDFESPLAQGLFSEIKSVLKFQNDSPSRILADLVFYSKEVMQTMFGNSRNKTAQAIAKLNCNIEFTGFCRKPTAGFFQRLIFDVIDNVEEKYVDGIVGKLEKKRFHYFPHGCLINQALMHAGDIPILQRNAWGVEQKHFSYQPIKLSIEDSFKLCIHFHKLMPTTETCYNVYALAKLEADFKYASQPQNFNR